MGAGGSIFRGDCTHPQFLHSVKVGVEAQCRGQVVRGLMPVRLLDGSGGAQMVWCGGVMMRRCQWEAAV